MELPMRTLKTESKNTSKKICRNFLLLYRILKRVEKGQYYSSIARQLRISKQKCRYYIYKAIGKNLLKIKFRSSCLFCVLTPKGREFLLQVKTSSLPVRENFTRLHNLALKFPIMRDNQSAKFDQKVEINNWIKEYVKISFPIGITIEKTTRSIIIYFHQFQTSQEMFLTDFFSWVLKGIIYIDYYLEKQGIKVDLLNAEVIREHIANDEPEYNEKIDRKKTVEISLNRKARSILPPTFDAKAWIDKSLGNVEIETNDMIYEEQLLMMPHNITRIIKEVQDLKPIFVDLMDSINLEIHNKKLHQKVLESMDMTLKKIQEGLNR
jgi:hypothetical protein